MQARRLLLLPAAVFFLLTLLAVLEVARLSFFDSNGIDQRWVGVGNYAELARDPAVHRRLVNSFTYAGMLVAGQAGVSLLIALMIYDIGKAWRSSVMFALYLPTFTSGIIISTVWRWIFHPEVGLANWLLGTHIIWMADRGMAIVGISLILTVANLGLNVLIYMGALLQIEQAVMDAARIDGASANAIRFRILLPIILPAIRLVTLLAMISAFQVWEVIYMMSPVQDATNLMYDMFQTAFKASRYGLGAAKAIVLMVLVAVLTAIKRRLER